MDSEKIERYGVLAGKVAVCSMFALIVLAVFSCGESNPVDNGATNAKTTAILLLKSNLRDPGSLDVIDSIAGKSGENEYFVRIDYRAKNGFGGYSIERLQILTDRDGNVIEIY
jgi:hypothetical protein